MTLVVVTVLLGFPVALSVGWIFDLTPQGIQRTEEEGFDRKNALPRVALALVTTVVAVSAGWWVLRGQAGGDERANDPARVRAAGLGTQVRSLAVLPFEDFTGDEGRAYFAAGMHDALITALSRIGAVRVVSRTSVMPYATQIKAVPEIATELDVEALVEGSVLRTAEEVQVRITLIQAATEQPLWTETYQRDLGDVLALQKELAQAIAQEIQAELTPDERARLASAQGVNPLAQGLFFQGRAAQAEATVAGFREAESYYRRAAEVDPQFAAAFAELAAVRFLLGANGAESQQTAAPAAWEAADRAMSLDSTLAVTHTVMGAFSHRYDWEWETAEHHYLRALNIDPSSAVTRSWYAFLLSETGRHDEAIEQAELTLRLDPLPVQRRVILAQRYHLARRHEEAELELHSALQADPASATARDLLEQVYIAMDRVDEAVAVRERWLTREGASPEQQKAAAELRSVHREQGAAGYFRYRLAHLGDQPARPYVSPTELAAAYARVGEVGQAFEILEEAYGAREGGLTLLAVDPAWDPLRDDPRFDGLVERVGL